MKKYLIFVILSFASTLTRAQVDSYNHNLTNCRTGFGSCDHSLLVAADAAQVEAAERQRNLSNCQTGLGFCEHSKLTSTEATEVEAAECQRNLSNCQTGLGFCDRSKLSSSEATEVAADEQKSATSPATTVAGPCAENGSCYGDLNANGVPKTVHVNGYYRKDGTYVRGHYRSAPGTNPRK